MMGFGNGACWRFGMYSPPVGPVLPRHLLLHHPMKPLSGGLLMVGVVVVASWEVDIGEQFGVGKRRPPVPSCEDAVRAVVEVAVSPESPADNPVAFGVLKGSVRNHVAHIEVVDLVGHTVFVAVL